MINIYNVNVLRHTSIILIISNNDNLTNLIFINKLPIFYYIYKIIYQIKYIYII